MGSWDTEKNKPEPGGGQGSDPGAGADAAAKPSWPVPEGPTVECSPQSP